ncbi:MAG: M24 family metallopeptidase, partial [Victivallales bacterium]|nr:M24 family metallopeptidase [Victivallales bacterium]
AFPHNTGEGAICANEPIVIDIFPRCCATGYFGDLTRTVVKGKAPDIVKKAFEAVYDAQRTVLQMLKPGVKGIEAHKKADDVMKAHGFKTDLKSETPYGFIHGLGHGVGLEIHEKPSLNLRNPKPLVAGNVVTIEPGLYYPEWGGIRIEDMAMITEDGIDNFTNYPVFLEIK